jgi:hypothetical protein
MYKIADKTFDRENFFFSYVKLFFLSHRSQNTYKSNERPYCKEFQVKILVLKSEFDPKKICGSETESEKNSLGSTTLQGKENIYNA